MVNKILTAAGLQGRCGRFPGSKPSTYAVWLDEVSTAPGPDPVPGAPMALRHDITLELYEDRTDDAKEAALEAAITAEGLVWTKQDRYWLQTEQQYQVIYEFNYTEKRRA